MNEDYYLRPFSYLLNKNNDVTFNHVEILRLDKDKNFEIRHIIDLNKKKIISKKMLLDYEGIKSRLSKITNPTLHSNLENIKKPLIMGIVNVTKDSFFDGDRFFRYKNALKHAEKLLQEGADIIDIGGESTRPGSKPLEIKEEIKRIEPLIKELSKNNILISCDTRNSLTMQVALDLGATIINDVSGLSYDNNTLNILKNYNCLYVLTHSQGTPVYMQNNPIYKNVSCDIYSFFKKKLLALKKMKISKDRIILDPGIGFGKKYHHNYSILKNLSLFLDLGHPILLGLSRKSFIKKFVNNNTLTPSVVLAIDAYIKGTTILRVHDVRETKEAIDIFKKAN